MKNKINYEKIKEIRKATSFSERWALELAPKDLIKLRTLDDRTYKSKFEFWNERRKDLSDILTCSVGLVYPPVVGGIINLLVQSVIQPISILVIPFAYANLRYSEDKKGYVLR